MKRHKLFVGLLTVGAIAFAGSFLTPATSLADPMNDKPKQTDHSKPKDQGDKNHNDHDSDKSKDAHKDHSDHHNDNGMDKDKEKEKKKDEMTGTKIGEAAPDFTLTDLDGKAHKLSEYKGKIVVLEWFNPGCPFILKHHKNNPTFNNLYTEFKDKGVVFLAVNSSAPGKEGHGKELNQKMHKEFGMMYPILLDEDGKIGQAYGAKNTPHCFIIDKDGKLAYKGAIDNDPSNTKVGSKNYVKQAVDQLIKGETVTEPETKPYGCSVKYAKPK